MAYVQVPKQPAHEKIADASEKSLVSHWLTILFMQLPKQLISEDSVGAIEIQSESHWL
jgi:hypothetical protein